MSELLRRSYSIAVNLCALVLSVCVWGGNGGGGFGGPIQYILNDATAFAHGGGGGVEGGVLGAVIRGHSCVCVCWICDAAMHVSRHLWVAAEWICCVKPWRSTQPHTCTPAVAVLCVSLLPYVVCCGATSSAMLQCTMTYTVCIVGTIQSLSAVRV